ncbi:aspartyl-tRNA(Asn)/glutamyl-tRNA(Gln) amidotransferase subunit A [Pelomonas saccharophila]|uniref:Aspartyl-tRNA(Asn)/glutamyl-tRNA(Gln) amidotransferase subunit A n=1 Tax=Roseateles saccharophilus TaxID=304 RepID=A0ABU1YLV2_ROSSA|nr:amidase [Roseateles saccharophilus]MDR7269838.1 aspartyl-tRNA(Asn)/glutamyl-tRNA(Gln) amidotransferase subunit A [Roseateles saccharophilus]
MTAGLHALDATALLAAYGSGELSPVEVMQAVLDQASRREGELHALCAVDAETALAAARESEVRWRAGAALALDGVPVTLKENIAVPGAGYRLGTAATADDAVADFEAPPAARLREAGAVRWARTTMPDYGMLSSGLSSLYAEPARNPWDVAMTPGGSSAGAAAAAAAGYGPLHLGTDIGGSIRLPAGWCGLVGLKPSHGRVPIKPGYAGRVAGPLARTVADTALMLAVLAQPDARDPTQLPPGFVQRPLDPRGLRIGLLMEAGWGDTVQPEVAAAIMAAARAFEQAGAIVEPLAPFTTREMAEGIDRFWRMRSWLDISALAPERRAKVLPYILDWVAPAAGYDGGTVFRGYSQMQALREAANAACEPFDFVLSPVAPMPAYPAHLASPLHDPARPFEHIAFTLPYNMSEQPALSINAGYTAGGLPIGLQVIGRRFDDAGVLALGALWEQLRPMQRAWPFSAELRG